MAVGVLLLTHPGIGIALRAVVQKVIGNPTLPLEVLEVPFDAPMDEFSLRARGTLDRLDNGGGVLILTDLYGASPSNLGARLEQTPVQVRRVSGLSLPMLLRVLNYPEQTLDALAATAVLGARTGVVNGNA
ncbi:PTS sugar transporter subunit IIA [Aquimonas sp.]|jgi:PTS system mannose-specific IIA component|uniref:PTS sugar transporter subunit IIA n=1 Tax=Aquimonas sp. TaxID=1872588 RepID=UPI0037BE7DCB